MGILFLQGLNLYARYENNLKKPSFLDTDV